MESKREVLAKKLNLTMISIWANDRKNIAPKSNGSKYTIGDIQGYIRRGYFPSYLGNITIEKEKSIEAVNLYNIIKHN